MFQYVGWYDDTTTGGLEKTAMNMIQADPNFGKFNIHSNN